MSDTSEEWVLADIQPTYTPDPGVFVTPIPVVVRKRKPDKDPPKPPNRGKFNK